MTPGLLAATLLVVFGPGLVVGLAGALRGWVLIGVAPAVTIGVIGVFGPLLPVLGIAWSPLAFLGATAVLAVVTVGIRILLTRVSTASAPPGPPRWSPAQHVGVAAAVLAGAGVGLLVTLRASRDLTAVPQWHDSTHHANAIRFIADTGNSSPAALGILIDPAVPNSFYPNGYYVVCATIRQLGDFGVVPVMDIVNGVIVGLFCLGLAVLVKVCAGGPALCAATGVLGCSISTFPYDVLVWGPLFPFTMGITAVPAFVALFCHVLGRRALGGIVLVAVSALGLVVVHTGAASTAAVLTALYVAQRWVTARRAVLGDLGLLAGIVALAVASGAVLVMIVLQSQIIASTVGVGSAAPIDWPEEGTAATALGQLIAPSRSDIHPQWWITLLVLVGLVYLGRSRFRPIYWWLAGSAFFAGVCVLTASSTSPLQQVLASSWSDDPFRLAAVAMLGLIVLAAVGVVGIRDGLVRAVATVSGTRRLPGVALGIVILAVGVVTGGFYLERNTEQLSRLYPDGPIVSTEKIAAMAWLAERVPPGSIVANDPLDGSPWMWAIEGIHPLFGSASAGRPDDGTDRAVVLQSLNRIDTDPRVQAAVRDLRISYAFVSDGSVVPGAERARGLQGLDAVQALEAVYQAQSVQIYRVRDIEPAPPS